MEIYHPFTQLVRLQSMQKRQEDGVEMEHPSTTQQETSLEASRSAGQHTECSPLTHLKSLWQLACRSPSIHPNPHFLYTPWLPSDVLALDICSLFCQRIIPDFQLTSLKNI
ncbi:ECU09_0575 [Encephalitozoon cuniculi GB-M1]|uniref:ECU09_0575 protein n=1 Tax=Encephalitozoon cuniculi (strain GB-M1) TaxID=284813 RepID=I7L4I6_ENCCU|nr:uncharacterized protein ECU09_0575 [Encephalitozoon cuniculi GB-M1]CCI73975.1 ECU09_0575 [Encephalitozoon cuniculi GB-M1]